MAAPPRAKLYFKAATVKSGAERRGKRDYYDK